MSIITIIPDGITEAQASAVYFLENSEFNTGTGIAAVVDIGGGTTDISFWKGRTLEWEDSVKFAGEDLIEILTDLKRYVIIEYKKEKDVWGSYELAMRDWPFVHKNWNDKMEDFKQNEYKGKIFRTMSLFYGGLCYYIGLHMKRVNNASNLNHLAFAGNGIRFLEIITNGNPLREKEDSLKNWVSLFREMISKGHSIPDKKKYETSFFFSQDPKLEIATGLVSEKLSGYKIKEGSTKKMFGLDFKIGSKKYYGSNWDAGKKAVDFSEAEINFDDFIVFIKSFKSEAQKLFKDWNLDLLPEEVTKEMQDDFYNSLESRGNQELANSLFLELLHSYLKCQYQF